MTRFGLVLLAACWSLIPSGLALGQPTPSGLKIPLLGFLVSNAPFRVRPVVGSPGAVVLGSELPIPDQVSAVSVAPGQQFAVIETSSGQSEVLPLTLDGSGAVIPIPNSLANPDGVAFSPSGTVAVLYSARARSAEVILGLPASPRLDRTVDLSAASLPLTSVAISDDAQTILAGFSDGSHGSIWSFAAAQTAQQIAPAGLPVAIRFFPGSSDAVAADRGWQQILRLPHGAVPLVLASGAQGIGNPSDLEVSSDLKTVWVSSLAPAGRAAASRRTLTTQTGQLSAIDLATGAVTTAPAPFEAANLQRLAGESVFLLSSADGSASGVWAPASSNASVWQLTGAVGQ